MHFLQWCNWLTHLTLTQETLGSNPSWRANLIIDIMEAEANVNLSELHEDVRKSYPWGYWRYYVSIGRACHELGVFTGEFSISTIIYKLRPKDWLEYFMNNVNPYEAVKEDLKEG